MDDVVGRIHQAIQIAAMLPALAFRRRNEHLERRIPRPRAHPREARIDPVAPFLDGHQRIGDAEAQVVMRMDARLRFRLQDVLEGPETVSDKRNDWRRGMSEITEYPAGKVAYIKRSIAVAYEAHRIRVNAVAPAVTVMARTNYQA